MPGNALRGCMYVRVFTVPVGVIFMFIFIVAHGQPADVYLLARVGKNQASLCNSLQRLATGVTLF